MHAPRDCYAACHLSAVDRRLIATTPHCVLPRVVPRQLPFSVGRVGKYLLHVRLRSEGLPLPGSPFALNVLPGPASGYASFMVRRT